jgi:hypothetical protein
MDGWMGYPSCKFFWRSSIGKTFARYWAEYLLHPNFFGGAA